MKRKNQVRVLFYDIETSLQSVTVFQLAKNDWIQPDNIVVERHLISVCWKWLGQSKVHSVSILDDPRKFTKNHHDDLHVIKTFHKVLSEADVIVGHNADRFDLPYLKTQMVFHGLSPLPPITSIDTYKVAKSQFMFNSNKLDYLGQRLGVGRKLHTTNGLWLRAFNGDKSAIREMVTYNKQDVLLLERVFQKLVPYMPNHVNRELFGGEGCPRCSSTHIQSRGLHRAISRVYQRFQCRDCGGWFRTVLNDKSVKPKFRVL